MFDTGPYHVATREEIAFIYGRVVKFGFLDMLESSKDVPDSHLVGIVQYLNELGAQVTTEQLKERMQQLYDYHQEQLAWQKIVEANKGMDNG